MTGDYNFSRPRDVANAGRFEYHPQMTGDYTVMVSVLVAVIIGDHPQMTGDYTGFLSAFLARGIGDHPQMTGAT